MLFRFKMYNYMGAKIASALICISILFIVAFGFEISKFDRTDIAKADAIIVLTGGQDRISVASDLLAQGYAQNLFLTGVGGGAEIDDIIRLAPVLEPYKVCCVSLGHEAQNTRGNAIEVEKWANALGYKSLIIVTSLTHLPRAMLEFEEKMPQIQFQTYRAGPTLAVSLSSNKWIFFRSLAWEAIKYFGAWIKLRSERLFLLFLQELKI